MQLFGVFRHGFQLFAGEIDHQRVAVVGHLIQANGDIMFAKTQETTDTNNGFQLVFHQDKGVDFTNIFAGLTQNIHTDQIGELRVGNAAIAFAVRRG